MFELNIGFESDTVFLEAEDWVETVPKSHIKLLPTKSHDPLIK